MAEEGALVECPVCSMFFEQGAELQQHVETHFGASQPHAAVAAPAAPATTAANPTPTKTTAVACPLCGIRVPLSELDSHETAHALEAAHAQEDGAQAAARRAAEAAQFASLQKLYGFADPSAPPPRRPGSCNLCGEPGHWAADCPRGAGAAARRRIAAQPKLPVEPAALTAAQRREPSELAAADVVPLLRAALAAELKAHTTIYLCGYAAHLCSSQFDAGWGCGYRNLQMLASHLLARRPELRPALFGGSGWLPDIPSLQAWLECAWARGFDPPGARQLGGSVQSTPKWIGTPEVCAVLRSFGVDARIVDFCDAGGGGGGGGLWTNAAGATVHRGVQCDGCGAAPIVGVRHKSTVRADYDLCGRCARAPAAAAAAPFITLGFEAAAASLGGGRGAGGTGGGGGGGGDALRRQALPPPGSSDRGDSGDDATPPPPPAAAATAAGGKAAAAAAAGAGGNKTAAAAGAEAGNAALVKWVWDYFSRAAPAAGSNRKGGGGSSAADASAGSSEQQQPQQQQQPRSAFDVLGAPPVIVTDRGPLYLQHEGHSRTVVGVEQCRRPPGAPPGAPPAYRLLILDPSDDAALLRGALAGAARSGGRGGTWQRRVKRGVHTLTRQEYQILYINSGGGGGGSGSSAGVAAPGSPEWEALKTIRADERIWS